jgi:hypothetical protein
VSLKVSIFALEWRPKKKNRVSVTDGQAAARGESYPARSHDHEALIDTLLD